MYVFDYGAPIGFRIALKHPEKILGIVSQNGNVYEEGLGPKWSARAEYWKNPTPDGLCIIYAGLDNDPEKIGIHMLEMLAKFRNEGIVE